METTTHQTEAYNLGAQDAKTAASWVIDGNTPQEHIARMVKMMDDGDPEAYDHLPREPNLSGEYADDLTPLSLARVITGFDTAHIAPEIIDAIADSYEAGVSETFEIECERILRDALVS